MKPTLYIPVSLLSLMMAVNPACKKEGNDKVKTVNKWKTFSTPYYHNPLDKQFINPDTGYILEMDSKVPIHNILFKTNDGGQTWKTITFSSQFLDDTSNGMTEHIYVSPFNTNSLFSSGQNLIRSIDGGYHWRIVQRDNKINPFTHAFF